MPQKKQFSSLLKETELAGRSKIPDNAAAARQTYLKELSAEEKVLLINEIIETRSAELIRAYRNLVQINFGNRQRRSKKTGKIYLSRQPYIVFSVKRKWSKQQEENADQVLPPYLYAYWTIDNERKLCAVPTDIVSATDLADIQPHNRISVVVDPQAEGVNWGTGTITCALRRRKSITPDKTFVLSCRHVFSMSGKINRSLIGTRVCLRDDTFQEVVAKTRAVSGEFRQAQLEAGGKFTNLSFDAQLAEVVNPANLDKTVKGLEISGIAEGVLDLSDGKWEIHAARKTIKADFLHEEQFFALTYGSITVRHRRVFIVRPSQPTKGGDSGSPILNPGTGKLIGMLIAGNGDTVSDPMRLMAVMIPAWQLFDPKNYRNAKAKEEWLLV